MDSCKISQRENFGHPKYVTKLDLFIKGIGKLPYLIEPKKLGEICRKMKITLLDSNDDNRLIHIGTIICINFNFNQV